MLFSFCHYAVDLPAERILSAGSGGNLSAGSNEQISSREACRNCWARMVCMERENKNCALFRKKAEQRIVLEILAALTEK